MTHYRQIIVNIAIEDNTSALVIEELKNQIEDCVEDKIDKDGIKEIEVKMN